MKLVSSPDVIFCGWLGSKHQLSFSRSRITLTPWRTGHIAQRKSLLGQKSVRPKGLGGGMGRGSFCLSLLLSIWTSSFSKFLVRKCPSARNEINQINLPFKILVILSSKRKWRQWSYMTREGKNWKCWFFGKRRNSQVGYVLTYSRGLDSQQTSKILQSTCATAYPSALLFSFFFCFLVCLLLFSLIIINRFCFVLFLFF